MRYARGMVTLLLAGYLLCTDCDQPTWLAHPVTPRTYYLPPAPAIILPSTRVDSTPRYDPELPYIHERDDDADDDD